jgi:hypothetical protein
MSQAGFDEGFVSWIRGMKMTLEVEVLAPLGWGDRDGPQGERMMGRPGCWMVGAV